MNRTISKHIADDVLRDSLIATQNCLIHAENVRCAIIFDRMEQAKKQNHKAVDKN